MNSKTILGLVAVVVVLGAAYYFWPETSWPGNMIVSENKDAKNPGSSNTGVNTSANGSSDTLDESDSVKLPRDPMMAGIWRSDADVKFTREFRSDGTIVDRHVGGPTDVSGTWVPIDAFREKALISMQQALSGKTVVRVVWDLDGKVTYFTVDELTSTKLRTTDTASNGAMIAFTKI